MEINHRKVHDLIVQAKKKEPLSEERYRYITPTREEVLGMRYKRGDDIIDLETGEGGEVIGGIRETVTKG